MSLLGLLTTTGPSHMEIHQWVIPTSGAGQVVVRAEASTLTLVVGANGSGKSALMQYMYGSRGGASVVKVAAHRQLWFPYAAPSVTPAQLEMSAQSIASWDNDPRSRYWDQYGSVRAEGSLVQLNSAENQFNRRFRRHIESGGSAQDFPGSPSPVSLINSLFRSSMLPVQLSIAEGEALTASRDDVEDAYPAAQMSDGEKSALLLAAQIVTAPPSSVLLIDEPERHLHRSISSHFIHAAASMRDDCHVVLFTHDLELGNEIRPLATSTLVCQRVWWSGGYPSTWDLHEVHLKDPLPDSARYAILGGRSTVLFVEGEVTSLDNRIYRALLPSWAIKGVATCEDVIKSVKGLTATEGLHWITARGIVDGDWRTDADRSVLEGGGVFVLQAHEVESILYHSQVVSAVSTALSEVLEADPQGRSCAAVTAALAAIADPSSQHHLADAKARGEMRRELRSLADRFEFGNAQSLCGAVARDTREAERTRLADLVMKNEWDEICTTYPIRESGAPTAVARALQLSRDAYQAAALKQISSSADLRGALCAIFGLGALERFEAA